MSSGQKYPQWWVFFPFPNWLFEGAGSLDIWEHVLPEVVVQFDLDCEREGWRPRGFGWLSPTHTSGQKWTEPGMSPIVRQAIVATAATTASRRLLCRSLSICGSRQHCLRLCKPICANPKLIFHKSIVRIGQQNYYHLKYQIPPLHISMSSSAKPVSLKSNRGEAMMYIFILINWPRGHLKIQPQDRKSSPLIFPADFI